MRGFFYANSSSHVLLDMVPNQIPLMPALR